MMMYKEFFSIEIEHQYFSSHGGADLTILPDRSTLRFLQGLRLIVKATRNGLKVLIPVDENGVPTISLPSDEALMFEIFPQSNTFSLFTVPSLPIGEILAFTNLGLAETDSELQSSRALDSSSLNGFPMVAKVEIKLTSVLLTRIEVLPYKVVFAARSAKWKYYLVADQDTTDLKVEDRGGNHVFTKQEIDGQSTDEIGMSLRTNFPEANLFLFESNIPIPCQDQALKNLELLRDGEVLIKHLPNPEMAEQAVRIINIYR